jgi:selenide, water dikinase
MQQKIHPVVKDLVLVGGGHSHAIVLKMFGMKPLPGVRLSLITEALDTPYSGMLPGHIAGFYTREQCHIDLRSLANFAQVQLYIDRVLGLDLKNKKVICSDRPPVAFDVLSIDIGSTPATISVSGAAEYAIGAKPVSKLLKHWYQLCGDVKFCVPPEKAISIAIVGGGAGGVELALSMQAHLQRILSISRSSRSHAEHGNETQEAPSLVGKEAEPPKMHSQVEPGNEGEERGRGDLEIHLFQRDAELMPDSHGSVRRLVKRILLRQGIHLHLRESVCNIEPKDLAPNPSPQAERVERGRLDVVCESGLKVECDRIFWVTQASAADWLKTAGLATDQQGFILVDDTLQSLSHPEVFATGDIAAMVNHPRPKAGVFAVRQGKPLFENLQRILLGKSLKPYKPQQQYLSLIGMGDGRAIATRGFLTLPPLKLLWQCKDWIDRRFMEQFNNLP